MKLEKVIYAAKAHASAARRWSIGRTLVSVLGVAGVLIPVGAVLAGSANDVVPFPNGFRNWFFVNSLTATADSPLFGHVGGVHHIYVNAKGLPTLRAGGPFPYPDGTVFTDDLHDFSVKDDAYLEGTKKAVTVMVKDSKKYATTGGWGFQVWAGGDPAKPQVPDVAHSVEACFACHTPQKAQDYTFSTYIP